MTKDVLLNYLRERYTYDAATGAIRHKGCDRVLKGAANKKGYHRICITKGKNHTHVFMHRAAWALFYGRWPSEIDHLNGIKTDNRLCNLREVSRSENDKNRVWKWKPNAQTGLPGVCYDKTYKDYIVRFRNCRHFHDKYEAFITTILLGRMYE